MPLKRDLTGKQFGRLDVLKFSSISNRKTYWLCRCSCGKKVAMRADQLTRGIAKSCGCLQRETARTMRLESVSEDTIKLRKLRAQRKTKRLPSNLSVRDLTGQHFGQLTVIKFAGIRKQQSLWRCRCSCGKTTTVTAARLGYGWTKSCGCLQRQGNHKTHDKSWRGGKGKTPEYTAWASMKTRCLNPNNKRWAEYGGRGISICKSWLNSFEAFLADMGPRPSPQHSLDRRNNNGNYNKRNCRWATSSEQNSNRNFKPRSRYQGHGRTGVGTDTARRRLEGRSRDPAGTTH